MKQRGPHLRRFFGADCWSASRLSRIIKYSYDNMLMVYSSLEMINIFYLLRITVLFSRSSGGANMAQRSHCEAE